MPVLFRIPVPLRSDGNHGIKAASPILTLRHELGLLQLSSRDRSDGGDNGKTPLIAVAIVLAVVSIVVGAFIFMKCRRDRHRKKYQDAGNLEPYSITSAARSSDRRIGPRATNAVTEANRNPAQATLDRNTSIRSIVTLPKYTNTANEGEQVVGRGGERDGVDIIVELPSVAEQEALRDEEMETMYQIRLARRQQIAERDERRRLMEEARERGDVAALRELRARRRAEYQDTTVDELREVQSQLHARRARAVSTVSYHELGVARHDGSRVRANSSESERVGLLSDAASISASIRSPSALSTNPPVDPGAPTAADNRPISMHSQQRVRSASSVLSLDENGEVAPVSGATTPRLGSSHTRAGSSPEIVTEADLGDSYIPPPDYEDVSLEDARSNAVTPIPFHEPPPCYSRRSGENESRDLASPHGEGSRPSTPRSSRGIGGIPRLPSLRIRELPQIIIEPSTANPSESGR